MSKCSRANRHPCVAQAILRAHKDKSKHMVRLWCIVYMFNFAKSTYLGSLGSLLWVRVRPPAARPPLGFPRSPAAFVHAIDESDRALRPVCARATAAAARRGPQIASVVIGLPLVILKLDRQKNHEECKLA